jgi:hypothetical protein
MDRVVYTKTFQLEQLQIRSDTSMNPLTVFGFFAVTAMVICYALEDRSRSFILGFAGACILGSIYGFLQGAWPFGAVELVWSGIAVHRWRKAEAGPSPSRPL